MSPTKEISTSHRHWSIRHFKLTDIYGTLRGPKKSVLVCLSTSSSAHILPWHESTNVST